MKSYKRIESIPPYLFSDLDKLRCKLINTGCDLIDLSIGDPDLPTPQFIIDALKYAADDAVNYRYPPYEGTSEFKNAVAQYYKRRFNVELDPNSEVIALIGSKEGIAHLTIALVDNGDTAIVPEPSYPIYTSSVNLAGGKPFFVKLSEDKGFLPDLFSIDKRTLEFTKLIFVNYPNNPTGAVCSLEYYKLLADFALFHDIIIVNDAAYNEIIFKGKPVSIMQVDEAKKCAIEFGSLSKSYNMAGWRIGYAVGNRDILRKLAAVKSNIDSGQFGAIQYAAAQALNNGDRFISYLRDVYKSRRDETTKALSSAGIDYFIPDGSFYIWCKTPDHISSSEFAYKLADKSGVLVTPGYAFGKSCGGYFRLSLTNDMDKINKAVERIESLFRKQ